MNRFRQIVIRASMAILSAAMTSTASAQIANAPEGLSAMTVGQARIFAKASGGTVRLVEDLDDGNFEMTIDYPGKIPVYVHGVRCTGAGDAKRCPEFESVVYFGFDSEAEALTAEHTLDIVWLSDKQIGTQVKVWRYEFVYGMTSAHLEETFRTFLGTIESARDIAYPETPDEDGEGAAS